MDVPQPNNERSKNKIRLWARSTLWATLLAAVSFVLLTAVEYLGNPWLSENQGSSSFSMGLIPYSQHLKSHNAGQLNQVQVYSFVNDLFARLPSGTDIDEADFPRLLTPDMVNYLQAYQVKHIKVVGTRVTADLASQQTIKAKSGADVRLATQVSFDVRRGPGGLTMSNVQGMEAYVSWLVGWMTLEEMRFNATAGGGTHIDLQFATRFGQVDRSVAIAADGTVTVDSSGGNSGGNSGGQP